MKPLLSMTQAGLLGLLLAACATASSLESRKQERSAAYATLSEEQRALIAQGKIKTGMSPDAVYIAWGPASEVVESESAEGHLTVWIYYGQWVEEYRYWIGRRLESDYQPRNYVQAEVVFQNGVVTNWRTLPKPQ